MGVGDVVGPVGGAGDMAVKFKNWLEPNKGKVDLTSAQVDWRYRASEPGGLHAYVQSRAHDHQRSAGPRHERGVLCPGHPAGSILGLR